MNLKLRWRRIPRRLRLGAVVGVPVLGVAVAGALVVSLTGGWPLDRGGEARAASSNSQDEDTPSTGSIGPRPPVGVPPESQSPPPQAVPPPAAPPGQQPKTAPYPAAQPAQPPPPPSGSAVTFLAATLDGRSEVPAAGTKVGDQDGQARLVVRIAGNQLCFSANWRRLGALAGAHVHAGAAGANGPVRVGFFAALPPTLRAAVGCVAVPDSALAGAIAANPAGYYVNLHTAEAPDGAVRGQLARAAAPVDLMEAVRGPLVALASGNQEVPDAGDANGGATGFVRPLGREIGFAFTWGGIAVPTAGHLHTGGIAVAGDVAVDLFAAPAGLPDTLYAVAGVAPADPGLTARINRNPGGYYFNLHNRDFAKGAVRGQLFRAG